LQQGTGQATRPGPDFEYFPSFEIARHARDPVEQLRIEQEVLAQRLAGTQPMVADDFTKRGKGGHASANARFSAA
jgi:hypothetical protein